MPNISVCVSHRGVVQKVHAQGSPWAINLAGSAWFRLDEASARLTLRPGAFSTACFEGVARLVVAQRVSRLVIDYEAADEPAEVLHNTNDILARLDFLRGRTPGEGPRDTLITSRLDLGRLSHPKRGRLAATYAAWRRCRGHLSGELTPHNVIDGLADGHVLVKAERDERIVVHEWPQSIVCYLAGDMRALSGRDLSDQPDRTFGQWSTKPYRDAVRQPGAYLDLIEAVVRPSDMPSTVVRYERLLLPWRSSSGAFWMTGTQLVRSHRLTAESP